MEYNEICTLKYNCFEFEKASLKSKHSGIYLEYQTSHKHLTFCEKKSLKQQVKNVYFCHSTGIRNISKSWENGRRFTPCLNIYHLKANPILNRYTRQLDLFYSYTLNAAPFNLRPERAPLEAEMTARARYVCTLF